MTVQWLQVFIHDHQLDNCCHLTERTDIPWKKEVCACTGHYRDILDSGCECWPVRCNSEWLCNH